MPNTRNMRNTRPNVEPAITGPVEYVCLSALEERRDLNPRWHLDHSAIQEYVRRLHNGEQPPPIIAHRATGVICNGAHRYHAYKQWAGEKWPDLQVPVVFCSDLPDPNEHPDLFRLAALRLNRDHGVRISRRDKTKVLIDLIRRRGLDEAMRYRSMFGETQESMDELVAALAMNGLVPDVLPPDSAIPSGRPAEDGGVFAAPSPAYSAAELPVPPRAVRYRPEAFPTGRLVSGQPLLRRACRDVRRLLDVFTGRLTDADREELLVLREAIDAALGAYSPKRRARAGVASEGR